MIVSPGREMAVKISFNNNDLDTEYGNCCGERRLDNLPMTTAVIERLQRVTDNDADRRSVLLAARRTIDLGKLR